MECQESVLTKTIGVESNVSNATGPGECSKILKINSPDMVSKTSYALPQKAWSTFIEPERMGYDAKTVPRDSLSSRPRLLAELKRCCGSWGKREDSLELLDCQGLSQPFGSGDGRVTNDKNYRMARSNFVEITVIRCKVMRRSEVRMGLGGDKDVMKEQAYWACSPQGGASIEESRRWVENRLAGTEVKGMEETERHSSYTLHKIVELKNSRMGEAEVI
ncbi:hypothetical protein BLNAU_2132 [Blattamonas nauphoetae]|uniref:Uncharacterized protein n=1 Tax=Blattamonas nauphoetae TaxID=2049346 RepID=A0ABQ9YHP0_9EUKA|nr:hypothetical protein BLNAU_2132 [Blattamonas nauphoetae]